MYRFHTIATGFAIFILASTARFQATSHTTDVFAFNNANDNIQVETISVPASCQIPNVTEFAACKKGGTDVIIGGSGANPNCQGQVTIADGVYTVGRITINAGGSLIIADAASPLQLTTTGIDINGGSLLVGSPDCPIGTSQPSNKVTIRFTGLKPTDCGAVDLSSPSCPGYVKGIQVEKDGTLKMYGRKGVPGPAPNNGVNWTYLSQPAGDPTKFTRVSGVLEPPPGNSKVNANVIYTAARVDNGSGGAGFAAWLPGDWIVIATTSFSPWESEFVQIDSAVKDPTPGAAGSKITLRQALAYYHFGGPPPGDPSSDSNFRAGSDPNPVNNLNFGVDERAEVGLISRSILLTSDSDQGRTNHWGGELKFLNGFAALALQGVELQKFGKEQLGSYPIHFHMDDDLSNVSVLVDSNSIDHSYNKCITVHSTQNVSYTNNVCARITGHIFYEEVGNETNVTFKGNLGVGAMSNSFDVNRTAEHENDNRALLISKYYWIGDNMFSPPGMGTLPVFDQINIFDTDNQYVLNTPALGQPFRSPRGTCGALNPQGKINLTGAPGNQPISCYPGNSNGSANIYFEPPSGFWLLNPSAKLLNNSIAGCQDTGAAYWYATPPDPNSNAVKFIPIGPSYPDPHGLFQNNRGHGCYRG